MLSKILHANTVEWTSDREAVRATWTDHVSDAPITLYVRFYRAADGDGCAYSASTPERVVVPWTGGFNARDAAERAGGEDLDSRFAPIAA